MGLHYYLIMLDFCEMNSVFEGIFRVLLFGKYFLGFLSVAKYLFWVVQKYPTPLIPVSRIFKSTPWTNKLLKLGSVKAQTYWLTTNVLHFNVRFLADFFYYVRPILYINIGVKK